MKLIVTIIAVLFSFCSLNAQNRATEESSLRPLHTAAEDSIAEKLARIAMSNTSIAIQEDNVNSAKYELAATKTAWLDNFHAAGNLNEFTIQGRTVSAYGNSLVYPRYNVGVSIPLGIFINQPKQTKAQYYKYQAEVDNLKREKENLRLLVITAYYDYLRSQRLFELQEEVLQDAEFAFKKSEEKFEKGEINVEVYTGVNKRYNSEKVTKINLERDLIISKAQLETLIGMPLAKAIAMSLPRK